MGSSSLTRDKNPGAPHCERGVSQAIGFVGRLTLDLSDCFLMIFFNVGTTLILTEDVKGKLSDKQSSISSSKDPQILR